jgi:Glycosyltransferase family 9 (heptosyltransferase)
MVYYFAPIAEGLGDLLITLPALQALIKTGVPTYLVIRSPKQEGVAPLIPGLAGCIKEPDFLAKQLAAEDRFINLRNHYLQTEYLIGTDKFFQTFGRITIVDFFERISKDLITRDLNIECDFRHYEPLPFKENADARGQVLLVPGSAGNFKCWPAANWIALHKALKDRGLRAVVVGQPHKSKEVDELLASGLPWLPTPTFADAVDVVSSAQATISVDTGLMHLSVQQGKPTVGLHMDRSIFVRREPNSFPVFAPDCIEQCLGWTSLPPNPEVLFRNYDEVQFLPCSAPAGERCMDRISLEMVLDRLPIKMGVAQGTERTP